MQRIWFAIVGMTMLLSFSPAWGHGTGGDAEVAEGVRVKAAYDDGDPMSYAAVEVIAPDSGVAFQTGRTDRNGVFMFAPDRPGSWQIVLNDGIGHRLVMKRDVPPAPGEAPEPAPPTESNRPDVSRREGGIAGISIIFGLCGLLYGWKARRGH